MLDNVQVHLKRDPASHQLKLMSGLLDRPGGQLYMLSDSTGRVHTDEPAFLQGKVKLRLNRSQSGRISAPN